LRLRPRRPREAEESEHGQHHPNLQHQSLPYSSGRTPPDGNTGNLDGHARSIDLAPVKPDRLIIDRGNEDDRDKHIDDGCEPL
jgi:hypothetical protein